MPDPGQQPINANPPLHDLAEIISPLRLGTYLNAAGHDADKALRLYLWNARIGEAFHIPIQSVEVGLRNRVSDGLSAAFGPDWWQDAGYLALADAKRQADLSQAIQRLNRKGKALSTGQLIASLSFGFWIGMLHKRYNPTIWSKHLATAFPSLPAGVNRIRLHSEASEIAELRNRIWHHEPIFYRNLMGDYSRCMAVLNWLCPTKASWVKPYCRVPTVIRERP